MLLRTQDSDRLSVNDTTRPSTTRTCSHHMVHTGEPGNPHNTKQRGHDQVPSEIGDLLRARTLARDGSRSGTRESWGEWQWHRLICSLVRRGRLPGLTP